ncbi:related to mitochondrial seryl-tRNA synthetases [Ustilago trichophora]|uniref:serine--tRNA ligase n=1 Tax=Ustilago trichophora TaxID=86804 RepID=A0A5C3ETE1_9BASI|nr:related to mitochondrial seryl-tRNA synthetases [Ustilago trichophora]
MSIQPSGPIWRALARSSSNPRTRHRALLKDQYGSSRHASTSRVTLSISKSVPCLSPAASQPSNARSSGVAVSSSSYAPKQRRLFPPQHGRGVQNSFIDEAKRDMQMRKMRYDEAELQWLREARHSMYALNGKQMELQKLQKQLTTEINQHFQADSKAGKKGKRKAKELSDPEPCESGTTPIEDESKDAAAEDKEQHIKHLRERARKVKEQLDTLQEEQEEIRVRSLRIRLSWPNHCHPDVPIGPEENAVLVSVKDPLNILPSEFDVMKETWNQSMIQAKHFPEGPKADPQREHLSLAASAAHSEVDMVSGALTTGSSWPYLLGSMSLLEHALSQYAMSIAVRKGFMAVSPPDVVRADLADRCGFRPRDEKAKQTYFLEASKTKGSEHEQSSADLCLAATAEIPLAGLLASRILDPPNKAAKRSAQSSDDGSLIQRSELPIKLAALGHAFRAEAGARGADTRGLYRVHQFSKIEMFVTTVGDVEASNAMLEELRETQEEVIAGLGLPYRVLDMPTEELGASAYRKYDIEVWMPGRGSWGEVSSASNCTDYQSLRLGLRLRRSGAKDEPQYPAVHTLNATAAAIPRLIVAILENHGVESGKLVLPDTLKPFWLAGDKDPNVSWLYTGKLEAGSQSRLQRALTQVRSIARKNGTDAPTMVASFLILHELTAIVPLIMLFYVFGALGVGTAVLQWLLGPAQDLAEEKGQNLVMSRFRAWARAKEERFERYCRKKGYLGFEKEDVETMDATKDVGKANQLAGSFVNMVAAYILVKALIPVRIGASVAWAGPFSRSVLEPLKGMMRRAVRRAPSKATVS